MEARSHVELPPGLSGSFEVYVNGVQQRRGVDYELEAGTLVFSRELRTEGRLGFWRWLSLFLGVAGTYRKNEKVDVVAGGRVITLEPEPAPAPPPPDRPAR